MGTEGTSNEWLVGSYDHSRITDNPEVIHLDENPARRLGYFFRRNFVFKVIRVEGVDPSF
jgi:hypothetical protein